MQAERDYLKHVVFPLVEEELEKRRIKLEIVDLRWGIDTTSMSQEDEREANVLKVCIDEIKRCRPFFIGLLGDRYGWVPPEKRMQDALVGEAHIKPEKGKSVTALEIEFGVLASKEQLTHSVFWFRDPLPYDTFDPARAALFSDKHNSALSAFEKAERKTALEKLKARIRLHFEKQQLSGKVKSYSVTWDEAAGKVTGLKSWGEMVYDAILTECESYAKDTWDKAPKDWMEQELNLLDAFIEGHAHVNEFITPEGKEHVPTFCGRKPLLEELKKHLLSDDAENWGLVLTGESGSGKSAVFSMVTKTMQKENCFILAHSAELSSRAKSVAGLLQIWNKQLADHLGIKEELNDSTNNAHDLSSHLSGEQGKAPVTPIEKLQEKYLKYLRIISTTKRVVLLIDALDRFEPTSRAQHLSWLPSPMPQNIRLLLTSITGAELKAVRYHKGLTVKNIDIFTTAEAKEMLDSLCLRQHKTLPVKIEKIILDKKRADGQSATSSPLWLSLAVNMLMAIDQDDFEKISKLEGSGSEQIEKYLDRIANDFSPLPGPLFISLTKKAGVVFGTSFTKDVFDYIAISRNGLREMDLKNLLPYKAWDSLQFANLRRWFKSHLTLSGEGMQWNIGHNTLKKALLNHLPDQAKKKLHNSIAEYLIKLPDSDKLKVTDSVFHLMEANEKEKVIQYYASDLNDESVAEASKSLAEIAIYDNIGLEIISSLPKLVVNDDNLLRDLSLKYIFPLNNILKTDGNLNIRLSILSRLSEIINREYFMINKKAEFTFNSNINFEELGIDYEKKGEIEGSVLAFSKNDTKLFWKATKISLDAALGQLLQEVGKSGEALQYFDSMESDVMYDSSINETEPYKITRAISLGNIGSIHLSMGNKKEALICYEECFNIYKNLYTHNPSDKSIRNGFAVSNLMLGDFYRFIGVTKSALEYYLKSNKLMSALLTSYPNDESILAGYAASMERLGFIYEEIGEFEEALKFFTGENKLFKSLYQGDPRNVKHKLGLVTSYDKMGDVYKSMNHLDEADRIYKINAEIASELYKNNQSNELYKTYFANSFAKCGSINFRLNKLEESANNILKYNNLMREIVDVNPGNLLAKNGLANSYRKLVEIYIKKNKLNEVSKCITEAIRLFTKYFESDPQINDNVNNLGHLYALLGDYYTTIGKTEEALIAYNKYNSFSEKINKSTPESKLSKINLAISYERLSSANLQDNNIENAIKYAKLEITIYQELYDDDSLNFDEKINLANKVGALGDLCTQNSLVQEALEYFLYAEKIFIPLIEKDLANESLKESLAKIYSRIGSNYESLKNIGEAIKYYKHLHDICDILYQSNSFNEIGSFGIVSSAERLSALYEGNGQISNAVIYYNKLKQLLTKDKKNNNNDVNFKAQLAGLDEKIANMHESLGNYKEALICYENFYNFIKPIFKENSNNPDTKTGFAALNERLGVVNQLIGNQIKALSYFEKFNELCSELYDNNRKDLQAFQGLGISFYRLAIIYKEINNDTKGLECFRKFKQIFQILALTFPNNPEFNHWISQEYKTPTQFHDNNSEGKNKPYQQQNNSTIKKEEQQTNRISNDLENYQRRLNELIEKENSIRKRGYNPDEFQKNIGDQAYILSKMGRYKEALQNYQTQAELCARNGLNENYADSLLSQAEILADQLGKVKEAKSLLKEAIQVAEEYKLEKIKLEAIRMFQSLK